MGGEGSGVSDTTRDILLESAFFAPRPILGKARAYALHTDSSHRFERGVDPRLQVRAIERATTLLLGAIWLGIALDGIPESLIIGSTMQGTQVSLALIGGLFLANFPESMSSAVVMKKTGSSINYIIGMWTSLMVMMSTGSRFS